MKILPESTKSSEATLVHKDDFSTSVKVCKFNKYGHCKLGLRCRVMHINTLFTSTDCSVYQDILEFASYSLTLGFAGCIKESFKCEICQY